MHIHLNDQNQFLRVLPTGNVEFDANTYQPAHTLTPEQADAFRVRPMQPTPTPAYNTLTHDIRAATPLLLEGTWTQQWDVYPLPADEVAANFTAAREAAWNRIKAERDRRKFAGVKVGQHWFHSDDSSRIQQLALAMMGANMQSGLQWKTLTLSPPPVFVTMTPALAAAIFQATAASDAAIFAAAEAHRIAMEASSDPQGYDCTSGWPATIDG